jgi:D-tagatose-1,6-bisphosphate aldolase subunit GatZ/KbaZ
MFLDDIVAAQKRGEAGGIPSVCSAHAWVLQAAMEGATQSGAPLLVEATCNQVDQFGGYTGMRPVDFVRFVDGIAAQNHFPKSQLILGGDHLGPSPWASEPAEAAMDKARTLVRDYVRAGFTKIHLDCSMPLGGEAQPPVEVIARRTADLAKITEQTIGSNRQSTITNHELRYIIGTEVPVPGGAQEHETGVEVTPVARLRQTLDLSQAAFTAARLDSAWARVRAVVVQPGVEFGDDFVLPYNPGAAAGLSDFIKNEPGLVYEAHSTDYQSREALGALVAGGFAILKVGPALTFAFREAVFALAKMEEELFPPEERSGIVQTIEDAMLCRPGYWEEYYRGDEQERRLKRRFSLSDRLRYYWPDPGVQAAFERLLHNLGAKPLPLTLVSQYAPVQYERVRRGNLAADPGALIRDRVRDVLRDYDFACGR